MKHRFSIRGWIAAARLSALMIGAARADLQVLIADQDPNQQSFFTLDFGAAGGETTGFISNTRVSLAIDVATKIVRIASYHQNVEALMLPGGFSTGAIVISIIPGSSSGEFDPDTGEFTTNEFYEIAFEGDLSAFGLFSPVFLPGASNGIIENGPNGRTISQAWIGTGQLNNPQNPKQPIIFEYTCEIHTNVTGQFAAGDMNCDGNVNGGDIDSFFVALVDPESYAAANPLCDTSVGDMTDDGLLNGADIDAFFACLAGNGCP